MSKPQNFRSAIHGFHREDVVNYIDYLVNRHNGEVDAVKLDARRREEELQARCDALEAELAAFRERPDAPEQLELLKKEHQAELDQQEKLYEAQIEALQEKIEAMKTDCDSHSQAELEAYRRAERVESQARERAQRQQEKGDAILTQIDGQVRTLYTSLETAETELSAMAERLRSLAQQGRQEIARAADALAELKNEE